MGSPSSDSSTSRIHDFIPWLLATVSVILPLLYMSSLADPFQLPKDLLFRWGSLLILGFWLWGTLSTRRISLGRSGVTVPILLLIFIALLSIFQAPNPAEAISAVRDMALCAVVFFLSLTALEKGSRMLAASLGLGATVTAALGTLQLLFGPRVSFLPPTQGGALVGDVTTGAIFVAIVLPMMVAKTAAPPRSARLWAVGTGISLAYVVLARCRAAWLGATVGLIILALLALRAWKSSGGLAAPGPKARRGAILSAIFLAVALCVAGAYGSGTKLLSSPPSLKTVELQGPQLRLFTWQATFRILLSQPLGVGAGSWRRAFPREAGNLSPDYPFNSSRIPQSAGNEYLEIAAELGVAGLVFFLWIFVRLISSGGKGSPVRSEPGAGAAASLAAAAACGLLASPLREQPGLWTVTMLASLVVASGRARRSEVPPNLSWEMEPGRRRVMGLLAGMLFLLLLAVAGWDTHRTWAASTSLQAGQAAYLRGEYARALPLFRRAAETDPASSFVHYLTGACALATRQLDLAEEELTTARRLSPQDAATLLALASTLQAKGKIQDAVGICEKARRIWPRDEAVNLALGDLRSAAGDRDGGMEAYQAAVEGNPHSVTAYLRMGSLLEGHSLMNSAVSAYSKAASLDPYLPAALEALGAAYMRQGNYEAAVPVYSSLLEFRPDDLSGLLNLARTLAGMQRPCEALPLLQKARDLDRDPSDWARLDQSLADLRGRCDKSRASAP